MVASLTKYYPKPPLDYDGQINLLKSRGLTIGDECKAKQTLMDISYFRLTAYLRPMEQDSERHIYKPGALFESAVELYMFDETLRLLVFSVIQMLEISFRSRLIHTFSLASDAFWYFDESLCADKHKFLENLNTLERERQRSKEDFIKEHKLKYGADSFMPAWKILEIASFGTLVKLYTNYARQTVKKRIARSYGIPQHEMFTSWLVALNALRNNCAHHDRVWNRTMPLTPLLPKRMPNKWIANTAIDPYRLYAQLCCLAYWLNSIRSANSFAADLKDLLSRHPTVDPAAMGFPKDWEGEPLWQA